jgi:hypothetical protein
MDTSKVKKLNKRNKENEKKKKKKFLISIPPNPGHHCYIKSKNQPLIDLKKEKPLRKAKLQAVKDHYTTGLSTKSL